MPESVQEMIYCQYIQTLSKEDLLAAQKPFGVCSSARTRYMEFTLYVGRPQSVLAGFKKSGV